MKAPARLALILFAGLSLAGCVSKTALTKPAPVAITAREVQPMSARDYFFFRDLDDKMERSLAANINPH